jgi:hypothetical protein
MRLGLALLPLTVAFSGLPLPGADWINLLNGKNLDGWEVRGEGIWIVIKDGTLVGQRDSSAGLARQQWPLTRQNYQAWRDTQCWLYTVREFGEFDLRLDYWIRRPGNSGVSIRDPSRAQYGITTPADFTRTPSKLGYEIQINNGYPDPTPTGSIYGLAMAKTGYQFDDDWNTLDIQSRTSGIRVSLNGHPVAEHPGVPARPKTGSIGLQLHDQYTLVMFRNLRLRELTAAK